MVFTIFLTFLVAEFNMICEMCEARLRTFYEKSSQVFNDKQRCVISAIAYLTHLLKILPFPDDRLCIVRFFNVSIVMRVFDVRLMFEAELRTFGTIIPRLFLPLHRHNLPCGYNWDR